jgi:hypothetical protein
MASRGRSNSDHVGLSLPVLHRWWRCNGVYSVQEQLRAVCIVRLCWCTSLEYTRRRIHKRDARSPACRVLVYWDGDAAHYPALIDDYDEKERYHLIYDDGSLARGCVDACQCPCLLVCALAPVDGMPRLFVLRAACFSC